MRLGSQVLTLAQTLASGVAHWASSFSPRQANGPVTCGEGESSVQIQPFSLLS